jgi:hypothetical protein
MPRLDTDAARQVMTLLLASSLSRAVGGRIGLSESEVIEFLAAPGRKPDEFLESLQRLREQAWYLHREDQRLFVKETENLSRQIERNAKEVPQPKIDQALINRLTGILQPDRRQAYQDVQVLPRLDEIRLSGPRTLIVIKPDGKVPPSELQNFFDYQQEKNNLLVLTGQDSHLAEAVEDRLRELYAIEQIHKRLKAGDTLFEEARDRLEEAEDRFAKALSAAYNRVYFPSADPIDGRHFLASVTIDNGLKLGKGDQSAEAQIETLLASPRANYKLVANLTESFGEYFAMAEEVLWPSGKDNRRTPWKDVVARAKSNPDWPWMPGAGGMDTLKAEALKQGRWRLGEDGYIEKGPFPKDKTTVNVSVVGSQPDTGATILSLTPRHAGESPVVVYATRPEGLVNGQSIDDLDSFTTTEGTLYFLARDTTGHYETGAGPLDRRAEDPPPGGARRRQAPRHAGVHAQGHADLHARWFQPARRAALRRPFEIGAAAARLLVYARAGEANKTADFQIPASGDKTIRSTIPSPSSCSPSASAWTPPTVCSVSSTVSATSQGRCSRACALRSARARRP